jgi:crossover junction endodeoxyribonuclease RuvC
VIYIGIDPGKKGGIGIINNNPRLLLECNIEMPLDSADEIDCIKIFQILNIFVSEVDSFCIIEKAQSMPQQGVKSMFNYGRGYGELIAVLKILKIPYQEIQSQKWKKEFSLIKKDKKASIAVAEKLFPEEKFYTERGRAMDGKAEALLIAEFARRTYQG